MYNKKQGGVLKICKKIFKMIKKQGVVSKK